MTDIYCHIHTPINIEEENKYFLQPLNFGNNLYIIKEKKLQDILLLIGYFQEYHKFTRENGYESIFKWLNKKDLLNTGFLEAISQYWIEDIPFKQILNYKYFQKNNLNKPIISDKYLKTIFQKVYLYGYIKEQQDKFNEKTENELNIIEKELSFITDSTSLRFKKIYYQNKIFEMLIDNFLADIDFSEKLEEINNINFSCETLLSPNDLFVYKTASINEYKDFNFKLTKTSHSECLRENTFIKLYANSSKSYYEDASLKYLLEELKTYSQVFTNDLVDFGIEHLKKIIRYEDFSSSKKPEIIKYMNKSSSVTLLQKTQTIISESEDHIISRYNSLKTHTNIYFAPHDEILALIAVLNMDKENLKRLNNLIREKSNTIETNLIKFTFKKGNLPYSAYGFAGLNF